MAVLTSEDLPVDATQSSTAFFPFLDGQKKSCESPQRRIDERVYVNTHQAD